MARKIELIKHDQEGMRFYTAKIEQKDAEKLTTTSDSVSSLAEVLVDQYNQRPFGHTDVLYADTLRSEEVVHFVKSLSRFYDRRENN